MYNYNYSYSTSSLTDTQAAGVLGVILGIGLVLWIIIIALAVLEIIGQWKMFKKAGRNGYEALIPIHSTYVMLEIGKQNTAYIFLALIPVVGVFILSFMYNIAVAQRFGKSTGFGVLMTFFPFICYPILGMGEAKYSEK